jgi:hypothetical protein
MRGRRRRPYRGTHVLLGIAEAKSHLTVVQAANIERVGDFVAVAVHITHDLGVA